MVRLDIEDTYIIVIDNHTTEMCANNTSQMSPPIWVISCVQHVDWQLCLTANA